MTDLKNIGDTIRVRTRFDGIRVGIVTRVYDDIKDGEPGYDYNAKGFEGATVTSWCFASQVLGDGEWD